MFKTAKLSSADMCQVAGATMKRLRKLVELGVLEPVSGGSGKGDHCRFSVMQALALTMFMRLVDAGLHGPAMAKVPEYLAMPENELRQAFRAGKTHLLISPEQVRLIAPPCKGLDLLDVKTAYEEMLEAIATLEQELNVEKTGRGRRRGLAKEKA